MRSALRRMWRSLVSHSQESLLIGGFAGAIGLGTALLWLPWAHRGAVGFLDALFTATSAVCVTGLVVVDTGTEFTPFGQLVILLLIQTGGIGVMAFAALVAQLLGRRLSLRAQAALSNSMLQRDVATELRSVLKRILVFVFAAEALGALLLFVGMLPAQDTAHAAYSAVFHAVSAFCNAGFSIYSDSLSSLRGQPMVVGTIMALIILGGLGHPVVVDLWQRLRRRRASEAVSLRRIALSSKVAIWTSAALILVGTTALLFFGLTPAEGGWSERLGGAAFQSVTARTAGFNTVDIGALPTASLMLLVVLMFVGGSPGSCAGGVKTTTFAVWLARLRSLLRGEKQARLFGRHIPGEIIRRGSMILSLALVWNVIGLFVLLNTETGAPGVRMEDLLFEQVSAFGTVGLSTGLTAGLSTLGKLWIVATMFVGRLGPLTLAVWAFTRRTPGVRYPEGRIMIG